MKQYFILMLVCATSLHVWGCTDDYTISNIGPIDSIIYEESNEKVHLQKRGGNWYMVSPAQGFGQQKFINSIIGEVINEKNNTKGTQSSSKVFLSFEGKPLRSINFDYASTSTVENTCMQSFTFCSLDRSLGIKEGAIENVSVHNIQTAERFQISYIKSRKLLSLLENMSFDTIVLPSGNMAPKGIDPSPIYPEDLIDSYDLKLYLHSSIHPEADEILYFKNIGNTAFVYKSGMSYLGSIPNTLSDRIIDSLSQ